MKNKLSATAVAIPLLFSAPIQTALADDSITIDKDGGLALSITANRRLQPSKDTLAPITVITSEEIERYQATEISDVLRRVPGLNISDNGGVGKSTSVFLRGTNSGHVLVLIDGVRHGSATLGSTSFQHIPLDQVERIEIVRGPRSSLYGSEAIGGVIQIFTKKGTEGFHPSVQLSAGSNDTLKASVNLKGGSSKAWYNLNVESLNTAGINVRDSYTDYPAPTFAPTEVKESDKDGYKRNSISLNTGYRFNPKLSTELSVLKAKGDTEYDGGFSNKTDFVQQVVSAKLLAKVNNRLNLRFSVGQSRDESDNFKNTEFKSTFDTKRDTASIVANLNFARKQSLVLGADWYNDKIDSTTEYAVTSRDDTGIFANYSNQINNTLFDLSLRYDDNQQFGTHTTGGIALGQKFKNDVMLKASYGTAFKAPTFNQLYFPNYGLETLKPEKSKNYEVGLSGALQQGRWEVNIFDNNIDNLIGGFPVSNIDKAQIKGIEASVSTQLGAHTVSTNYTYQDPKNSSGKNKGKLLKERPRNILNVDVDRPFGKLNLGVSLHAESKRYADASNKAKLAGFATLDLITEYAVSKNWSVGLKIANVLDKDYSTKEGYNQDGINGLLSIKYSPK